MKEKRGQKAFFRRLLTLVLFQMVIMLLVACDPTPVPLILERTGGNSNGEMQISGYDGPAAGLAGFYFKLDEGDFQLKTIKTGLYDMYTEPKFVIDYSDEAADDSYYWSVDYQTLPAGSVFFEASGDITTGGGINRLVQAPDKRGVPVLVGFSYTWVGGDHHIQTIRVHLYRDERDAVQLSMIFEDDCTYDCNDVRYVVSYALVPESKVTCQSCITDTEDSGSCTETHNFTHPVLMGFELNFTSGDHHLDEIAVQIHPEAYNVHYNDENDDDSFRYYIWVADLQE